MQEYRLCLRERFYSWFVVTIRDIRLSHSSDTQFYVRALFYYLIRLAIAVTVIDVTLSKTASLSNFHCPVITAYSLLSSEPQAFYMCYLSHH